jgi:2-polyprenyl-3-methyl-5-hydroxy-6-metoxy-1,4-benzoquinol methylase
MRSKAASIPEQSCIATAERRVLGYKAASGPWYGHRFWQIGERPMSRDHVAINRDVWDADAVNWVAAGERLWNTAKPVWGNWGISEGSLNLLPSDLTNKDAIELGCGTGYVSGWMARRGARVTGIDVSSKQLAAARQLAKKKRC